MKEGRRMLIHEDCPQDQERVSLASSWNQNWLKILYKIAKYMKYVRENIIDVLPLSFGQL